MTKVIRRSVTYDPLFSTAVRTIARHTSFPYPCGVARPDEGRTFWQGPGENTTTLAADTTTTDVVAPPSGNPNDSIDMKPERTTQTITPTTAAGLDHATARLQTMQCIEIVTNCGAVATTTTTPTEKTHNEF